MKTYCLKMIILLDFENIADSLKEALIQPRKAKYLSRCLCLDLISKLIFQLPCMTLFWHCDARQFCTFCWCTQLQLCGRAIHKPCTVWSETRSETSYLKDISQLWLQPIKSLQKQKITFLMVEALKSTKVWHVISFLGHWTAKRAMLAQQSEQFTRTWARAGRFQGTLLTNHLSMIGMINHLTFTFIKMVIWKI